MTTTKIELTEASEKLLADIAGDTGNWNGCPMVYGNVCRTKADLGNLTDLKKKGILETFKDEGIEWICFTDEGYEQLDIRGIEYQKQL